jgi:hypothetical protein
VGAPTITLAERVRLLLCGLYADFIDSEKSYKAYRDYILKARLDMKKVGSFPPAYT